MELKFYSVTAGGTNCVGTLLHELRPLEELAETWKFPYSIIIAVRCGKNVGKTFRRFDKKSDFLGIDIRVEDSSYMALSKNEQREQLGKLLFSYLAESIRKYPKFADKKQQEQLIAEIKQWMTDHDWLHGKIEKARTLLEEGRGTFVVCEALNMPYGEVEEIFISMYETGKRAKIHPDNIKEGKAMPPR